MPRPVVQAVSEIIKRGCVVMAYKTKAKAEGGKQLVSVGPHRTAVGDRGFVVIGKRWDTRHGSARSAAQHFVDFVGREIAWSASKHPRCHGR